MEEINKAQLEQLLQSAPGGIAKLAFDDMLSILYATDTFYSLIKTVTEKVNLKLPLALLRIVYSADIIYLTQQIAAQKLRTDDMINLNFRTLQQDGSFKWVMITGSKTEETYQSGSKSVPVYSCIAMDITNLMINYKKLEQTVDYQRAISELSKDLFFEYEIATDTLSFTEPFREVFGKEAVMSGFRKRLEKTKLIHPDELPAVISIYNSMMSGRKQARFELRLIPKGGNPSWYICYASIIYDENRNPSKVVGKLSTMNIVSQDDEKTIFDAELDPTTNVFTKGYAEAVISEAASKQEANSLSALLLIDIRNYKGINEIKRSINGENVMTTIGGLLKRHFRTSDMIGRLGLSEFVVYVKDLPSDKAVYELADKLCNEIEALHSYVHTKSGLTASIGIALHKGAQEYSVIMANANTALVMAKKVAASSFEVFNGMLS
jgi:diguanylate cyclase (GGDEF)-like protein